MASVPPTKSLCSRMLAGHSGWASVIAPGSFRFSASRSPTLKISWTMHAPSHRIILRPGHFLQILAQVAIRHEQDLVFRRHAADDLLGVAGGDDPVGQGLDGGGAVDVGDGLEAPAVDAQHLLIAGQLVGRAALGQAATGLQVGQQHALVGIEHLGRLGHEVDAAKDDGRGRDLGGGAGQFQAVAGEVGQLLDLAVLVVVGEDGGVVACLEVA